MSETPIFCELCGQLSIWWKVDRYGRRWSLCDDHRHAPEQAGPERLGDIVTRLLPPLAGHRRRRVRSKPFLPDR